MLRATALAFAAATVLSASAVSAQTIDLGRGAPRIDLRSDGQRERDYRRNEVRRERDLSTGSLRDGCRETTIRERDDDGRMVTRTRRDCR